MGGAAYSLSLIQSFGTKKEWVANRMQTDHNAFASYTSDKRADMFGQIYDLAVPPEKKSKK